MSHKMTLGSKSIVPNEKSSVVDGPTTHNTFFERRERDQNNQISVLPYQTTTTIVPSLLKTTNTSIHHVPIS